MASKKLKFEHHLFNYFHLTGRQYLRYLELHKISDEIREQIDYSMIDDHNHHLVLDYYSEFFIPGMTYVELIDHECNEVRRNIEYLRDKYNSILPEYAVGVFETVLKKYKKNDYY